MICLLCCEWYSCKIWEHINEAHPDWANAAWFAVKSNNHGDTYRFSKTKYRIIPNDNRAQQFVDYGFYLKDEYLRIYVPMNLKRNFKKINRMKHHLKPWKNPDSMFCDTEFLKEFFKKEIQNF